MATGGDGNHRALDAGPLSGQQCGACEPEWHVVSTEFQAETLAQQSVSELGFATLLPLIRRRTEATKARPARTTTTPAFPGYLFAAWLPDAKWGRIRRAKGVDAVLMRVGVDAPAVVPAAFLAAMRDRMDHAGVLLDLSVPDLLPALEARTWVRIIRGPLAGQLAFVEWSTEDRVALLLEVLGGERRAKLRRDHVEPTDPLR